VIKWRALNWKKHFSMSQGTLLIGWDTRSDAGNDAGRGGRKSLYCNCFLGNT
jgi:hypothetical protein